MPRNTKSNAKNKTTTRGKGKTRKSTKKRGRKTNLERKITNAEILSTQEVQQLVKENSFVLDPTVQNNWFEKCFEFEAKKLRSTEQLHDLIFSPTYIKDMEEKNIVTLFGMMLKDSQFQKTSNIKIAEIKENARIIAGLSKMKAEQIKRQEIKNQDTTHVGSLINTLLDESLRIAMNDQLEIQTGGINTYRPPENKDYEVISIDENADD